LTQDVNVLSFCVIALLYAFLALTIAKKTYLKQIEFHKNFDCKILQEKLYVGEQKIFVIATSFQKVQKEKLFVQAKNENVQFNHSILKATIWHNILFFMT